MPPTPPDRPALEAHVDGGARGNPGPAGYGVVIRDSRGGDARELRGFVGIATNNVAEYAGLIAALRYACEHGASSLTVYADSELVVRQMNGQYRVKAPGLKPLHAEARRLALSLPSFRIVHVARERNAEADRLANLAMDEEISEP
jgi:ribonuclease HI